MSITFPLGLPYCVTYVILITGCLHSGGAGHQPGMRSSAGDLARRKPHISRHVDIRDDLDRDREETTEINGNLKMAKNSFSLKIEPIEEPIVRGQNTCNYVKSYRPKELSSNEIKSNTTVHRRRQTKFSMKPRFEGPTDQNYRKSSVDWTYFRR